MLDNLCLCFYLIINVSDYILQVSYEDFRIHMARMYQQYERQQVDHIADPAVRRSRPVSVISGVTSERHSSGGVRVTEAKETASEATQYDSAVDISHDAGDEPVGVTNHSVKKYIEKVVDDAVNIVESGYAAYDEEEDAEEVNMTTEKRPSEPQSESEAVAAEKEAAVTGARSQATSTMADGSGRPSTVTYDKQSSANTPSRQIFSPGPRAPPFRIPEFRWSYLHQKLLSDVLGSLEQDMHAWKM